MKGLIDTTLREGAQQFGVNFSLADKIEIISALAAVGIEEIELGVATPLDHELPKLMARAREVAPRASLALWSRCRDEDIQCAATLAPDTLSLSLPVSDLHITTKLGKSRSWVEATLRSAIRQARNLGIARISLGLEDASRADRAFLAKVVRLAVRSGVKRIRLADTVGIATPAMLNELLAELGKEQGFETGVHCHNDFGMATANALSALEAGADWADVTVLGLGERTGNSRLEEVAAYLALRAGRGYRTEMIPALSRLVSAAAGYEIPRNRPVVGEAIFNCETGLHLHGLEKAPETYEPYPPQKVGGVRRLLHGHKTGRHSLCRRLAELRLVIPKERLDEICTTVRQRAREFGRPLKDQELIRLCSGQN